MAEPRVLVSPKENIAQSAVLSVTDAQNRIKALIVESYYSNWPKARLESEIAKIINQTVESYSTRYQNDLRRSLAVSAQRWHISYMNQMHSFNLQTLNLIRERSGVYSIDLVSIANGTPGDSRLIVERFRPILTQDKLGSQLIDNYEKRVRSQISMLASDPANMERIDKNGKAYKISLRNFAEMEVRYQANLQDVERLKNEGVKLVMASSHADCSERCSDYQGRLFSLDGSSGVINNIPYSPLQEALDGPKGDGNGIINGYNCRHRLIEYSQGMKPPRDYDRDTIRKENAITARQRNYENQIRKLKAEEALCKKAGYAEEASKIQSRWQALDNNYKNFSLSNQRPFYPWRTKVSEAEIEN